MNENQLPTNENTDESFSGSNLSDNIPEISSRKYQDERQLFDRLIQECSKVIVGQEEVIEKMIICIISDGHILLEGVPGIAKTLTARTLAKIIDTNFSRIQFTPDLMPGDIIGTPVFNNRTSEFEFKKGPIFSNIVLIDEINRAPAKTQSALFEVMEEKQVSFDGITYNMDFPFLVIATQNPIEQEGTYRLPEAQLDRFLMKIILQYPKPEQEIAILQKFKSQVGRIDLSRINTVLSPEIIQQLRETAAMVNIEDQMLTYIATIIQETRNNSRIFLGASPRASLGILKASKALAMLSGRNFVIPDDIQYVATDILNHRILLSADAEIAGETTTSVINEIIKQIEVPR